MTNAGDSTSPIGHWSLVIQSFASGSQLGAPLGPRLHPSLLRLGLAFALGWTGELLGALFAANPLVVDLGPALGAMPILDCQDELGTGADANHDSAAFLLNESFW
jgi:hypothetical protein